MWLALGKSERSIVSVFSDRCLLAAPSNVFFFFQKNRVNQFLLFHFFTFPLLPSPLNCPASFDSDAISSMLPPLERHQHRGGEQQRPRKQQQQLFHRLFFSFY